MSKYLVYLSVFVFGVVLAFIVASQGGDTTSEQHRRSTVSLLEEESAPAPASEVLEEDTEKPAEEHKAGYQTKKRAMLRSGISPEKRIKILTGAIQEGTLDSLDLIRTEYLSFLPEYESEILPALKKQALESLLIRFTEKDWTDWRSSSRLEHKESSAARVFVNDLILVNPQLGRFVETASQLFHGMYVSILGGNPYDLQEDLYYVIHHAEELLDNGFALAVPARLFLDTNISEDPVFIGVLERLRGELVVLYTERYPQDMDSHITLLLSLNPKYCTKPVFNAVRRLIYRLVLDASVKYREDVFDILVGSKTLSLFVEMDPRVRQALAEFYIIGAVDALEIKEFERAKGLLEVSIQTKPGLKAQDAVGKFLESMTKEPQLVKAEDAEEEKEEETGPATLLESTLTRTEKQEGEESLLASLQGIVILALLIVAVVLVGGRVFLYFLGRRSVSTAGFGGGKGEGAPEQDKVSITSPSEISFDDDSDTDAINQ